MGVVLPAVAHHIGRLQREVHGSGQSRIERSADEARQHGCHHGRSHQAQHHGASIHHFHHDDEGRQRRLGHCGQKGRHAQRNQGCQNGHVLAVVGHVVAHPRAHGQTRGEDAARHAGPGRQPGGQELEGHEQERRAFGLRQHVPYRFGPAAERGALCGQPDACDQQPQKRGEGQWIPPSQRIEGGGRAIERGRHHPREQPAQQTAGQRHPDTGAQHRQADGRHDDRAQEMLVAKERDAHQTGKHDHHDDEAAVSGRQLAAQLLQCEHHPGQRRIERGRESGRATSHQQGMHAQFRILAQPAAGMQHHPGGHLDRRAFAPDRQPTQKSGGRQQDLGHRQPQRHKARALRWRQVRLQRHHHLRNARAPGSGKPPSRAPGHGHGTQGRPHQQGQRPGRIEPGEQAKGPIGQPREGDHAQTGQRGIPENDGPIHPLPPLRQFLAHVVPDIGFFA